MTLEESEVLLAPKHTEGISPSPTRMTSLDPSPRSPNKGGLLRAKSATSSPTQLDAKDFGSLVEDILTSAKSAGRLISGLEACSRTFETKPNDIVMCILPEEIPAESDAMLHICLTLIKAHCLETGVLQIRVQTTEKLLETLYGSESGPHQSKDQCLIVQRARGRETSKYSEDRIVGLLRAYAHQGKILLVDFPSH